MNEKPFTHTSKNGTVFKAARCDLRGGVKVYAPAHLDHEDMMADAAQVAAFHAVNIHPHLNGFAGYDCIEWRLSGTPEDM